MPNFSKKFINYFYGFQISEKYMSNYSQISSNRSQISEKITNSMDCSYGRGPRRRSRRGRLHRRAAAELVAAGAGDAGGRWEADAGR
jgi:hypothetical protein